MARPFKYEVEVIAEVLACRAKGKSFERIAREVNGVFGTDLSAEAARHIVRNHKDQAQTEAPPADVEALKAIRRTSKVNSTVRRDNLAILDHLNAQDELLASIQAATAKLATRPKVKLRKKAAKGRTKMTVEMLLSDLHFGKKTAAFNHEVARRRMQHYTAVTLGEIERANKNFEVEHIVIAMLGDIIESSTIHGAESIAGCEFASAEQVQVAIEVLMEDVIEPLAQLGIPITIPAVVGNHDRLEQYKTYNLPGRNGLTWVIYKSLEMMTKQLGYKHIKWIIPDGIYCSLNIYGDEILYEHGDFIAGGHAAKAFSNHLVKRSQQLGKIFKAIRLGHWHTYSNFDNGAAIVNASLPGNDSYADVLGFASNSGQVVSLYVQTKNRHTSYYHSLLVQLGEIV